MDAAPKTLHRGWVVKQVNSGDTIVLKGRPRGGPPPERSVSLAYISAPKLGRRPIGNEEATTDEPYAWEAREYLRNLLVGKEVSFIVEHTIPISGRECALVYIGTGENSVCVNELMVKDGWAITRNNNKQNEEVAKYTMWMVEAQTSGIGVHNEEGKANAIRNVNWVIEDPRMLFDELKGKPLKAVVESVRDGGTLRLMLIPSMNYITLMLTGIRCPSFKPDGGSEDHADEARYAVETRLLNKDIEILLEGTSGGMGNAKNQNFVGTVVKPGNISLFLLKEGLAKCVDWSMKLLTADPESYRAATKQAKTDRKRLWKNFEGPVCTVPKDQREFSGRVTEIVNGEVLVIKVGNVYKRVTMSSIRQPRPAEGTDAGPPSRALYEVPYLFEAREFLRKRLVGKKVNATVDYVRPAANGYPERVCASIFLGNQNIQEAIVSKGLATVAWHKQDDDERAANYDALLLAQEKAKKNKVGVHYGGEPPIHKVADLAGNAAKSKQFLPFLQRIGRLHANVEFVASGSRIRVYIPRDTCLATFLLSGISCPRAARPSIKGQPATPAEPFGDEALEFVKDQIMQREVEIEVESCDKAGNFIGYLFVEDKNMSVELVKEGLAKMHFTAERGKYFDHLSRAEADAKAAQKRVWKDYVETVVEKEETSEISDSNITDSTPALKDVVVTHIEDCSKLWVQHCADGPGLISLMNQMRADLISNPPLAGSFTPRTGMLCAAIFSEDNNWYRAKVLKVHKDSDMLDVLFIDYGNQATVNSSNTAALSPQFASVPGAASECQLAFIVPPEDEDWLEDSLREVQMLTQTKLSMTVLGKAASADLVSLTSNGTDIATHLLSNGLVEYEKQRNRNKYGTLMSTYEAAMADARKNRRNRFQYGDFTQDDAKEFGYSK